MHSKNMRRTDKHKLRMMYTTHPDLLFFHSVIAPIASIAMQNKICGTENSNRGFSKWKCRISEVILRSICTSQKYAQSLRLFLR
mmetsp:Transcript_14348/g.16585  ORF Transcript_14348/g.16585 Transcript_14348/m.16585 type:complete len:84 (-) Transcript_14348:91-342(-)